MLDLNQSSDGLKFLQRLLNFFASALDEFREDCFNLKAKVKLDKLMKEILPSTSLFKVYLKYLVRDQVTDKEKMSIKVLTEIYDQYYTLDEQSHLYGKKVYPISTLMLKKDIINHSECLKINGYLKLQTNFYKSKLNCIGYLDLDYDCHETFKELLQ